MKIKITKLKSLNTIIVLCLLLIGTVNGCFTADKQNNHFKGIKSAVYYSNYNKDTTLIYNYNIDGELIEIISFLENRILKSYYDKDFNYKNVIINNENDTINVLFDNSKKDTLIVTENNVLVGIIYEKKHNKYISKLFFNEEGKCNEISHLYYKRRNKEVDIVLNCNLDTISEKIFIYENQFLIKSIIKDFKSNITMVDSYHYSNHLLKYIISEAVFDNKKIVDSISVHYTRYQPLIK